MTTEQKDEIRFRVAKCLATDELNNRRAYFDADYNMERLLKVRILKMPGVYSG